MTAIETGMSYRMMDSKGNEQTYSIVNYDPKSSTYEVVDLGKNGRRARKNLQNFRILAPVRKCSVQKKPNAVPEKKSTTQLYIVQTGSGTYKIGCTDDLDSRMRAGRTWCANMRAISTRTIPKHKTAHWRRYESKIHKRLSSKRCKEGGNEVFKLKSADLHGAVKYMHSMRFD